MQRILTKHLSYVTYHVKGWGPKANKTRDFPYKNRNYFNIILKRDFIEKRMYKVTGCIERDD